MAIDKTKIIPSNVYVNGLYRIKNLDKYVGNPEQCLYRSSYERHFMNRCDGDDNVLKWSSEPFTIPYICPITGKKKNYLIDFYARMIIETGEVQDFLIEVKPKAKLIKPISPKKETLKKLKNYNYQVKEYLTNIAKFAAAKNYALKIGHKFIVITEEQLF